MVGAHEVKVFRFSRIDLENDKTVRMPDNWKPFSAEYGLDGWLTVIARKWNRAES